jgi:hypothetical protein
MRSLLARREAPKVCRLLASISWTAGADPRAAPHAPGVRGRNVTFAGIPDENQRADVIAYLRTLADQPAPLTEGTAAGK